MTWRRWWAIEGLSGMITLAAMWPLDSVRFLIAVVTMTVFSVAYHMRLVEYARDRQGKDNPSGDGDGDESTGQGNGNGIGGGIPRTTG